MENTNTTTIWSNDCKNFDFVSLSSPNRLIFGIEGTRPEIKSKEKEPEKLCDEDLKDCDADTSEDLGEESDPLDEISFYNGITIETGTVVNGSNPHVEVTIKHEFLGEMKDVQAIDGDPKDEKNQLKAKKIIAERIKAKTEGLGEITSKFKELVDGMKAKGRSPGSPVVVNKGKPYEKTYSQAQAMKMRQDLINRGQALLG